VRVTSRSTAGRQASTAGRQASTAVVLAAAGSSQPAANAAVAQMAADWQAAAGWLAVVPAYASAASPTPGQAVAALLRDGVPRVVVASYLLAPGLFADRIRAASLAAGAAAVSRPLGAAPEVADVLLQRYAEARAAAAMQPSGWPSLALATRAAAVGELGSRRARPMDVSAALGAIVDRAMARSR
jgi:sirohydrochlorin ferrochelatase